MRGLQVLVIGMGLLIVAGVAVLGVTILRRASAPALEATVRTLDEAPGTRIVGVTPIADRVGLLLQGGGPDRVVVLDPRTGRAATLVTLPR